MYKLFFFISIFLIAGCSENALFQEKKTIAAAGWNYDAPAHFEFEIKDTSSLYNIFMNLTATDSFASQNVYLQLSTVFPDGKKQSAVRSFDIFDSEGKMLGEMSGHTATHQFQLQKTAFFNMPGTYSIDVEQYTRSEPLKGIAAVELAVEKAAKK